MHVTVVTPSLPERSGLLAEAIASVQAQTVPCVHLVGVDHMHEGPAAVRNRLLRAVDTEWVAFLDDDDLLDPHHLERLLAVADGGADVAVPYCRFEGGSIPDKFCNRPYDREVMREHGIFPITVLARTEVIRRVGGFPVEARYEDWALWNAMADEGVAFTTHDEVTWTYRLGRADHRTNAGAAA